MIGWVSSLDQRGNIESLQRDGLARVKAVDAFRLPVRQNNNTCFCTVSRPTNDLNFNPPPPKKKKKTNFVSYLRKPDETRVDVMPNRIFIGILSIYRYLESMQDQKPPNDIFNQYNIDS